MANNDLADAYPVLIPADGAKYTSEWIPNVGLTLETSETASIVGYRSAWWTYTPATSGPATFDTIGTRQLTVAGLTGGTDTVLSVHTGASHPLTEVCLNDEGGPLSTSLLTFGPSSPDGCPTQVTGGTTYLVRVASWGDEAMSYRLEVTGPSTVVGSDPVLVHVPAAVVHFEFDAAGLFVPGLPQVVALDVLADVEVQTPVPTYRFVVKVDVPCAEIVMSAEVPVYLQFSIGEARPADSEIVPSQFPIFSLWVSGSSLDPDAAFIAQVEIRDPVTAELLHTLTKPIDFTDRSAPAQLRLCGGDTEDPRLACWPPGPLIDGEALWRARLSSDGGFNWGPFTDYRTLYVDPGHDNADYSASVEVNAGLTAPAHLWFAYPPQGKPTEPVLLVGTGFAPDCVGTPSIAWADATPVAATEPVICASADATAYGADRIIDADNAVVSVAHQQVETVVPPAEDFPAPGGPVAVISA